MNNLICITGPRGTGKTFLASTYLPPSRVGEIFYHDSEDSANNVIEQLAQSGLQFGYYESLKARFQNLPEDDDLLMRINRGDLPWASARQKRSLVDYYEYIVDSLDKNLARDKFKVYVHDTLEKLEAGMAAWVEADKKRAGVTRTAYGGLWTDGVYPLYEQLLSSIYARGVKTVILCSHLKSPWEGNRPVPGKVIPSGKKILYRLSSLFLWLVNEPNNADGSPAALVLKERMGKLSATEDGWQIKRMLPPRLPSCTWREINKYLSGEYTVDMNNLKDTERISNAEHDMISELLSDKQLELMITDAKIELETLKQSEAMPIIGSTKAFDASSTKSKALQMHEDGIDVEEIAEEVNKPLALVKKWVGENENKDKEEN